MGLIAHGPLSAVPVRAGRKALAHQAAGMSPAIVPEDGTRSRRLHWRCGTANPPGTSNPSAGSRPPTILEEPKRRAIVICPRLCRACVPGGHAPEVQGHEKSQCESTGSFLCVPCSIYTMMTVTPTIGYDHHQQCIPVCILLYLSEEDY